MKKLVHKGTIEESYVDEDEDYDDDDEEDDEE